MMVHLLRFNTLVTGMDKLADDYQYNLSQDPDKFQYNC